jgi:hypothetical protein
MSVSLLHPRLLQAALFYSRVVECLYADGPSPSLQSSLSEMYGLPRGVLPRCCVDCQDRHWALYSTGRSKVREAISNTMLSSEPGFENYARMAWHWCS